MFKNDVKIAWRNLKRNRSYTLINIFGLSLGISSAILIFTLVSYHFSFEDFHKNPDRIYRLVTEWQEETVEHSAGVPPPLGTAFRTDFKLSEYSARKVSYRNALVSFQLNGEKKKFVEEQGVAYTEPAYFKIFNFPLLQGDARTVLKQPNEAVITQTLALKYFGGQNPIGKTIRIDNLTDFVVKGVAAALPENTDLRQEIFLSYTNLKEKDRQMASEDSWGGVYSDMQCFVLLSKGVQPSQAEAALKTIVQKNYSKREAVVWKFNLQPLKDIHFNADYDGNANKSYLYALMVIGLFLLVTAGINFTNLATAQAMNRAKEIGIRKVLGSKKQRLFWQFMAETAIITLLAAVIAYGIAWLVLPVMNGWFHSAIQLALFSSWQMPLFLWAVIVFVIFLSGSYPGLVIAGFKPVQALTHKITQKQVGGFSLRRSLVVGQFAISQMLIIGTVVIAGQVRYIREADLGFSKEAIVNLPIPENDITRMHTVQQRLATVNGVEKVSLNYQPPASNSNRTTSIRVENRAEDERWSVNLKFGDDQYLSAFQMKLIAGRNLFPSDTMNGFIVNEVLVKNLNLSSPQEAIGKMLRVSGDYYGPIVGVVRDFHNYSLHMTKDAVCILSDAANYAHYSVKFNGRQLASSLKAFEQIWNEAYPDYMYTYQFMDDAIAEFYETDHTMLSLIQGFALIAILIGCLGLYGLVSFMALQKTKEIGVRKVLGASLTHILWIFGKEFSKLLLLAFFIAAPVAWWGMEKYLQDFSYRIHIGAGVFLLATGLTFLVAVLTVGYRSLRASLTNPVDSLRDE